MTAGARRVYAAWIAQHPGRGGADLERLVDAVEADALAQCEVARRHAAVWKVLAKAYYDLLTEGP